jgi:murein tripeptide amidase MpaA
VVLDREARRWTAGAVAVLALMTVAVQHAAARLDRRARAPARLRQHQQPRGRRIVIGRSVQGRPIVAWVYGPSTAPRTVLLIGVIHGNEQGWSGNHERGTSASCSERRSAVDSART